MKLIGKLLIFLLIALLVVILAAYFLIQTRWGAAQVGHWVTDNSDYQLTVDAVDHRFSSPSHVLLKNVTFGYWLQQPSAHRSAACRYHFTGRRDAESLPHYRAAAFPGRPPATE